MVEIIKSLYIIGIVPLMFFLMYIIALATPTDIIRNTLEFSKLEKKYYSHGYQLNLSLSIILCGFGFLFAIFDTVIQNTENLRGFTLISFAIMVFTFLFTSRQAREYENFIENVQKKIELKKCFFNTIKNREGIEKQLYYSRIFLFLGGGLGVIGLIFLYKDNFPENLGQFRYFVLIAIGYAFMNFGWGIERMAMSSIIQSQILKKLNSL
jgi:hypothetical protein